MNSLIRVLDVLAAVLIVVSLNLVTRSYKFWILYAIASILFVVVCVYNWIPGLALMGVFLSFTGVRNYQIGRAHV